MARTKLIAKYAALDTPDLDERIRMLIDDHIAEKGIEDLPYLEVNGRWTGTLSISDGGWRGDFDFLYPVLSMCRVDRDGNVSADIDKIKMRVGVWRQDLHTPLDDDRYMGVCDNTFSDEEFRDDQANDLYSAFYRSEMDSFLNSESPELAAHDRALTEIDNLFRDSSIGADSMQRNFGEGFAVERINSAEDYRRIMEAIQADTEAGGGYSWINPDFDMDSIESMFSEDGKDHEWIQFIDDLRHRRFGDLPADYDGLSEQ